MFDTLTEDERQALTLKLHDWAHRLFEVGHVLAQVALGIGDQDDILWNRRQQYVDARAELCALNAELVKP